MATSQFDIGQILAAAGKYGSASERASSARQVLGASSLAAGALGGSSAAHSLAAALQSFRDTHTQVAAGNASALVAFADRLSGVAGLGEESIDATTSAASAVT